MKQRYKFTIAYDGTRYVGWQHQKNGISIQQRLQEAFCQLTGNPLRPIGSGRTDSGVHAIGQVAHAELVWRHSEEDLQKALNSLLPPDIRVQQVERVTSEFHAQRDARQKWYRYVLCEAPGAYANQVMLFERDYVWVITQPLNLSAMRQAAGILKGEHDFKSFQGAGATVKSTIRNLEKIRISPLETEIWPFISRETGPVACESVLSGRGRPANNTFSRHPSSLKRFVLMDFYASGFLKQMVRNLVGMLIEVGQGAKSLADVKRILQAKDRKKAGLCAPPRGLYLMKVTY